MEKTSDTRFPCFRSPEDPGYQVPGLACVKTLYGVGGSYVACKSLGDTVGVCLRISCLVCLFLIILSSFLVTCLSLLILVLLVPFLHVVTFSTSVFET